uniref:Uncharacterized protein n=1 Tax=Lepeophtheirus salmonis TaxID=72036 RepID=A0A0K2V5Q3_LEPSM
MMVFLGSSLIFFSGPPISSKSLFMLCPQLFSFLERSFPSFFIYGVLHNVHNLWHLNFGIQKV